MTITVEGLNDVVRKLEALGRPEVFRRPMIQAVSRIHEVIAKYPPATAANRRPGINGYSWYVRGFGTRTVTGRAYATSEKLGSSWTTEVSPDGRQGRVGNDTTYGPYVQGEKQAYFHKERGWKTADQVVKDETPTVVGYFEEQFRRYANE